MPRKKVASSKTKKASSGVRKGKTNGDAGKRIRGTLLLQYRAVSAEYSECHILLQDCIARLTAEKAKPVYAPLVKLLTEHQHHLETLKDKAIELNRIQSEIAKKLGVTDLKAFFEGHKIDTGTGEVKPVAPASS